MARQTPKRVTKWKTQDIKEAITILVMEHLIKKVLIMTKKTEKNIIAEVGPEQVKHRSLQLEKGLQMVGKLYLEVAIQARLLLPHQALVAVVIDHPHRKGSGYGIKMLMVGRGSGNGKMELLQSKKIHPRLQLDQGLKVELIRLLLATQITMIEDMLYNPMAR